MSEPNPRRPPEAGETRTEWGVRDRDNGRVSYGYKGGLDQVRNIAQETDGEPVQRRVGPWVPVEDADHLPTTGRNGSHDGPSA